MEVTKNGCVDTSNCITIDDIGVGLAEQDRSSSVSIFPNPTESVLRIKGLTTDHVEYQVFNVSGQQVVKGILQIDNAQIDVNTLSKGMYYLILPELGAQLSFIKE